MIAEHTKVSLPTLKTAQYAINNASIHNTDIPRCLRNVSNNSIFTTSAIQILIEECRLLHQCRQNKGKTEPILKVGDVVKTHISATFNFVESRVKKLSYQAKGPFIITTDLGQSSFEVRRYNFPNSKTRKYKSCDLYLLPPHLFLCEELDTIETKYMNYSNAPLTSPLSKPLAIELYNDTYFPENDPSIIDNTTNKSSSIIDNIAFQSYPLLNPNATKFLSATTTENKSLTKKMLTSIIHRLAYSTIYSIRHYHS